MNFLHSTLTMILKEAKAGNVLPPLVPLLAGPPGGAVRVMSVAGVRRRIMLNQYCCSTVSIHLLIIQPLIMPVAYNTQTSSDNRTTYPTTYMDSVGQGLGGGGGGGGTRYLARGTTTCTTCSKFHGQLGVIFTWYETLALDSNRTGPQFHNIEGGRGLLSACHKTPTFMKATGPSTISNDWR